MYCVHTIDGHNLADLTTMGFHDTKGIYLLRRSQTGGTAKVEEYLPRVSGMSEGPLLQKYHPDDCVVGRIGW